MVDNVVKQKSFSQNSYGLTEISPPVAGYTPLEPDELKQYNRLMAKWIDGGRQGQIEGLTPSMKAHSDEKLRRDMLIKYPPPSDNDIYEGAASAINKAISSTLTQNEQAMSVSSDDIDTLISSTEKDPSVGHLIGANKKAKSTRIAVIAHLNQMNSKFKNNATGNTVDIYTTHNVGGKVHSFSGGHTSYSSVSDTRSGALSKSQIEEILSEPEHIKPIAKEQLEATAKDLFLKDLDNQSSQLNDFRKIVSKKIFEKDLGEIDDYDTGIKAGNSDYAKRKDPYIPEDRRDSYYRDVKVVADDYSPMLYYNHEVEEQLEALSKQKDDYNYAIVYNQYMRDSLESAVAQLKRFDEDDPLVKGFEEKYGEVREVTEAERKRFESMDGNATGKRMVIKAYAVDDLMNPDAKPISGQVFGDAKMTPKDVGHKGGVARVSGDFTKEPDVIVVAEGIASAVTSAEFVHHMKTQDEEKQLEGQNVWVVSGFNANNTLDVAKELYHQHPKASHYMWADNDVHIYTVKDMPENKGDASKQNDTTPVLDKDGKYQYMGAVKQGKFDLYTPAQVDAMTAEEQFQKLKRNTGAWVAREFNQYVANHPNKAPDGSIIPTEVSAFVVNKSPTGRISDYEFVAFKYDDEGKKKFFPPKLDSNDLLRMEQDKAIKLDAFTNKDLTQRELKERRLPIGQEVYKKISEHILKNTNIQKERLKNYTHSKWNNNGYDDSNRFVAQREKLSDIDISSELSKLNPELMSPKDNVDVRKYEIQAVQMHEKAELNRIAYRSEVEKQQQEQAEKKNSNYNRNSNYNSSDKGYSNSYGNNTGSYETNFANGKPKDIITNEKKLDEIDKSLGNVRNVQVIYSPDDDVSPEPKQDLDNKNEVKNNNDYQQSSRLSM